MGTKAKDPLNTDPPISGKGKDTYETIAGRLAALNPPIKIEDHIAQREDRGKTQFSSLVAHDGTLDGINFVAPDPARLVRAFEDAKDQWGERALASMREDPGHWALKASFGKTVGTGWREKWRPAPFQPSSPAPDEPGKGDLEFAARFGSAGAPVSFTALHCAVHEIGAQCNIHVDVDGFVLALPKGFSLTPNLYGHFMNELLLKTDFRDWLVGKMPNATAAAIVREVFRRTALVFPSAANGFAGLTQRINDIERPTGVLNGLWTAARTLAPTGVTFDLYETKKYKVQATGSWFNGDKSIAITLGGEW